MSNDPAPTPGAWPTSPQAGGAPRTGEDEARLPVKSFVIIYEDADLLAINKPAGLVCHPTKGDAFSSLISRARLYLNGAPASRTALAVARPSTLNSQPSTHIINRLDRETSGVVLIAKNSGTAGELGKLFESRAVEKEYLAIVHGCVAPEQGTVDAPLGKDEQSIVAIKDCVRPGGAPAQTDFFVERRFPSLSTLNPQPSTYSLLRVIPRTGRKHQIRIHLAHLGHPIVGDKLYGGDEDCYLAFVERRLTGAQRAGLILENHALHARAIRFSWHDRPVEFSCPPEPWFTAFLYAAFAD